MLNSNTQIIVEVDKDSTILPGDSVKLKQNVVKFAHEKCEETFISEFLLDELKIPIESDQPSIRLSYPKNIISVCTDFEIEIEKSFGDGERELVDYEWTLL